MEVEFESGGTFADTISAGSILGEGTAGNADGSATTAAAVLVSKEVSVAPSVAAGVNEAGLTGVVFDSCASAVAGALMSDLGFNRLAAGAGLGGDDDSERGPFEFVGAATAGVLVFNIAGEFELPAG